MADLTKHRAYIRCKLLGCGFDVTIEPPLPGEQLDREFPDHHQAFTYAVRLRISRGWPVVDLASDAHVERLLGGGG